MLSLYFPKQNLENNSSNNSSLYVAPITSPRVFHASLSPSSTISIGLLSFISLIVLSIIVNDFFNNDIVLAFDKYVKSLDESSPILNSFLILSFILSIPIFSFTDISI